MITANWIYCRSRLILIAFAALVCSSALFAQPSDDDEPADAGAAAPLRIDEPGALMAKIRSSMIIAVPSRSRLVEELLWKVDDVDAACQLTHDQKEKLRLAGQGDVKHFLDRFHDVQTTLQTAAGAAQFDSVRPECESLKRLLNSGLFEEGSLFARTGRHILTVEQLAKLGAGTPVDSSPWTKDFQEAKALAATLNRPVLIHFHAKWCAPCQQLERIIKSPAVRRYLSRKFVVVSIDVDENVALAREYRVTTIPCELVVTAKGDLLGRSQGLKDESTFLNELHLYESN